MNTMFIQCIILLQCYTLVDKICTDYMCVFIYSIVQYTIQCVVCVLCRFPV